MNDVGFEFEKLRLWVYQQNEKFYSWQSEIRPFPVVTSLTVNQALTKTEIYSIVNEVSVVAKYKLNVAICLFPYRDVNGYKITKFYGKHRYNCIANFKERAIYLPLWGCQLYPIIHELAHFVVGDKAGHGAKFLRLLFDLCEHFGIAKAGDLENSATTYGLAVDQS